MPADDALRGLVDAIAPLMDRDYCSPFASAWELDPYGGSENRDGEVIYEQVRAAWDQAKAALEGAPSSAWIVAIDRPYYPSVERFTDYDAAVAASQQATAGEQSPGGAHEAHVYIAEVRGETTIRTDH